MQRDELDLFAYKVSKGSVDKCYSTAGPRPVTGPWHQLYRATRGSPGSYYFSFL